MGGNAVEIKAIAREAGVRSKIAVASNVQGIDPVGTFVGGHGTRINAVRDEIGSQEMIDIVVWDDDISTFIANAMKPANVVRVEVDEKNKKATVVVVEDQLSIAIGKAGQNVRLAGKLSGFELDVEADKAGQKPEQQPEQKEEAKQEQPGVESKQVVQKLKKKSDLENSLLDAIEEHGTEESQTKE
jgi:N utilization substance protein A